jgi:outer membrane putative beta-barrel porin/alpha-amylase
VCSIRYSRLPTLSRVLLYVLIFATPALCEPLGSGAASTTPSSYSLGEVLFQSAIGKNKTPFTPLSLWNFGEGWLEPWIPPPGGELDLQRGGWVSTFSGFFSREIDPSFTFNAGTSGTRDEYVGSADLFVPLNRRFQLGLLVPFVNSLQSSPAATSFGDLVVQPQLMLDETETRSVSAFLAIRTPTGESKTGNDQTRLTPVLALWQDLPANWQLRGGVGMDFATHTGESPDEVLELNLATGNTFTGHGAAPFGDLTPYLSANLNQDLGSGSNFTNFSLTPGIRFFLGYSTYFITGVVVPVTNPRPFLPGLTTVLSTGW